MLWRRTSSTILWPEIAGAKLVAKAETIDAGRRICQAIPSSAANCGTKNRYSSLVGSFSRGTTGDSPRNSELNRNEAFEFVGLKQVSRSDTVNITGVLP